MASVYPLPGKVALVTGAARGIGFETARLLHDRGASVAITDLDAAATERAAAALGERALGLAADVTDAEAMQSAVAKVVERFGGLDIVMANAGVGPPPATMRVTDPDDFERVVEIDLLGVWRTVRAALPHVVERKGHFVLVSSIYAWVNGAVVGPYAVSKAGVEALGRSLRTELAVHGATASVAHFGFIDTKMVRVGFSDPVGRRFTDTMPTFISRRLMPAEAAAATVAGIESRAPRIIVPGFWKAWFALRGILNPLLDRLVERDERFLAIVRDADDPERARALPGMTPAADSEDAATPAGAT